MEEMLPIYFENKYLNNDAIIAYKFLLFVWFAESTNRIYQ